MKKIRTIVLYDKNDNKVQVYALTSKDDIYNYMTVNEYRDGEYLKELKWKDKNDLTKGYANTQKIYYK